MAGREIQISNILEARLAPSQWNRIKIAAWQRRKTYSTITRYCVLKLARKTTLKWTTKLRQTTQGVEQGLNIAKDMHRHLVCLYGEDEKLIRLAAIELGLTLTAFIRLAIELYLQTLAMVNRNQRFVSNDHLTWEGIRFTESVQIFATNSGDWPAIRSLNFVCFEIDSYWR